MSAHVQDDPGRVVVIADELESIFHVLIFYVVRFCHHTLRDSDVGQFLYDYFDDYSPYSHGERAGRTKRTALEQGAISLITYNGTKSPFYTALRFIWPSSTPGQDPDFNHPLNRIIPTLLSWFQALYALDTFVDPSTEGPAVDHRRDGVKIELDEDDSGAASTPQTFIRVGSSGRTAHGAPSATNPHAKFEETKKLASKLNTHAAMLDLLRASLVDEVWPMDEKTKDKRSKKGHDRDCDPISSDLPPAFHGLSYSASQEESQLLEASQASSVSLSDDEVEWEEPEEVVEDEDEDEEDPDMEMENVGMQEEESQTEGTLVEDELENPFVVGLGLPADAVHRSWTPPSPSCLLSSTASTSSRKRRLDEPDEPTTPTKRSRIDD